jgi:hypothetical protein
VIERTRHRTRILQLLENEPVVGILGARQVGKTTLARQVEADRGGEVHHLDLEDPDTLARLQEPKLALEGLRGLVVLDEIQRRPDLFPLLRVLADRPGNKTRFLILGSASPQLLQQSSESLAGRIIYHELTGFSLDEVGVDASRTLWLRGGFPRSFLAPSEAASCEWRQGFIRTFLERDLPLLGIQIPSAVLHRFWQMLAHYHGQVWNGAELARAFGVSASTVRRYLELLSGALVVRQLQPWSENIASRQVKSPKVYITDAGVLHALLRIERGDDLEGHPKVGASWEGFVLQEVLGRLGNKAQDAYFWATHAGAEVDLLLVRGRQRIGFEFKRTTTPTTTRSMHTAIETLKLDRLEVVHAGRDTFPLGDRIRAIALADLVGLLDTL